MAYASTPLTRAKLAARVIESLNVGGKLAFRFNYDSTSSNGIVVGFRERFGGETGEAIVVSDHSQAGYNGTFYILETGSDGSGVYYTMGENPSDTAGVTFSVSAGTGGSATGSEPVTITQPIATDPGTGGSIIKKADGTVIIVGGGGSGGGSAITVQDEGSSLSTAATVLNFTGSGVTATGAQELKLSTSLAVQVKIYGKE